MIPTSSIRHLLILLLLAPLAARAQTLPPGPQVLSFFSDVDDTEQPYAIYLPRNFDESRRYPLVISLHGAGSNHRLNLQRVFGRTNRQGQTDVEASRAFADWKDVEYIVASPFARGTMGYQGVAEKDVMDVLADVKRRFRIDENRVYLTGLSMGGGGTLWLGLSRPDIWAAIAPVCPAPPPGVDALAENALNLPAHFFHGDADPVVPVDVSRQWVDRLADAGAYVDYEEYEGVGHNSWDPAYADGRIFDWFDRFERDPHPQHVRFTSDRYDANNAYWVRLDELTPGTPARIDARFTSPGELEVMTSALDGFTLTLAGHPSHNGTTNILVDGAAFDVSADSASFHRIGGEWRAGRRPPEDGLMKRRGLEGPMKHAVAGRHVFVFGTRDVASAEDAAPRQQQAVEAANWSAYRGSFLTRVMVFPRIIADREVRPSDIESGNLILLGTRETNAVIAEAADRLPMHLTGDPARFGLAYVYPLGDHYALVSSGVPWWHVPAEQGGWTFGGELPPFQLSAEHDFILYDGAEGEIIAAGRFDNRWRLPAEAADAMRRAVEVNDATTAPRPE